MDIHTYAWTMGVCVMEWRRDLVVLFIARIVGWALTVPHLIS